MSATKTHSVKSPRELYNIAKQFGQWDPAKMPLEEDRRQWESLNADQREQFTKVCALFYVGEVSVAETITWFTLAMPDPDRRMFLSTHAFEEVKHAEFFELYFRDVLGEIDFSRYLAPGLQEILLDGLRKRGEDMGQAMTGGDRSALDFALTMFAAHYMGLVEGVIALNAYNYVEEMLASIDMFPQLREAIRLIRIDEGRHITHGMDYLREQVSRHPEYRAPVKALFLDNIKSMTLWRDYVFNPNPFGLDRDRLSAMGYELHRQRMREAGVA